MSGSVLSQHPHHDNRLSTFTSNGSGIMIMIYRPYSGPHSLLGKQVMIGLSAFMLEVYNILHDYAKFGVRQSSVLSTSP